MVDDNKHFDDGKPEKTVTIIVNLNEKEVPDGAKLDADQIVKLAFGDSPTGDCTGFAITYRRGRDKDSEAILGAGQTVILKEGMIFNVTRTDKS